MGRQYEKFISKENFILAYTRLKTVKRNEYKEFYYKDFEAFELFFEENIEQLICEAKEGIYKPSTGEKYYIPKKKNLARPITMLCLLDQIIYQAITNVIADEFYPLMSRYFNINTFGNIFKPTEVDNKIFFYEKWKSQWKKFKEQKRKYYAEGYEYTVEFDIASFYDTIDHFVLFDILSKNKIENELINLLKNCLSQWTITPTTKFGFKKSCGIPQGPISSAFYAEVYLYNLDEEMRKQKNIKYFRYADDISIMAKTSIECQRMVVYLDLLARDLSLIPQSEKIGISHIDNIDRHINNVTAKFSKIANEYQKNDNQLKASTHNFLKRKVLNCFKTGELDKTIIGFALFKLNKDDDIKNILISNINKLELFYKGVIYYFDKHYPGDEDFDKHISSYLLGDSVLYQHNKSLLFKSYNSLAFREDLFRLNYKDEQRFWIVKYQLIHWLHRCGMFQLITQFDNILNYYIQREINDVKNETICEDCTKQVFLESLISDKNVMISLQGLRLWNKEFYHLPKVKAQNGFIKRIIDGEEKDYIKYIMESIYNLVIPDTFLSLFKKDEYIYNEIKENLRIFINKRNINPSESLMALDLVHNIFFDIIAEDKGYTKGDFGRVMNQMDSDFPLSYQSFKSIHEMRNQRTLAHYKDKNGNPRIKISYAEFDELLQNARLGEVYSEIFEHYKNKSTRVLLSKKKDKHKLGYKSVASLF